MKSKPYALVFLSCGLILVFADGALAKAWRGIMPLYSTRADVRGLLGKPIIGGNGSIDLYEVEEGRVQVRYARKACEQSLPADWGNWNVPRDTVVNISITLNKNLHVNDLGIPNFKSLKWYTDDSSATYYVDKRKGIEYQVQEGMVTAITYGPAAKDRRLLCKKNVPLIRY